MQWDVVSRYHFRDLIRLLKKQTKKHPLKTKVLWLVHIIVADLVWLLCMKDQIMQSVQFQFCCFKVVLTGHHVANLTLGTWVWYNRLSCHVAELLEAESTFEACLTLGEELKVVVVSCKFWTLSQWTVLVALPLSISCFAPILVLLSHHTVFCLYVDYFQTFWRTFGGFLVYFVIYFCLFCSFFLIYCLYICPFATVYIHVCNFLTFCFFGLRFVYIVFVFLCWMVGAMHCLIVSWEYILMSRISVMLTQNKIFNFCNQQI